MKKLFTISLLIIMILSLFSCNNMSMPDNVASDTSSNTGVSNNQAEITDVLSDYDSIDDSATEDFIVKAKKYEFEEKDLVILNLENHSGNNYTITVNMKYYDESGNKIASDSQSFEGFAANWQKYFLFMPEKTFENYEYEITTEEFTGECLGNKLIFTSKPLVEMIGFSESNEKVKVIQHQTGFWYDNDKELEFRITAILFDNQGNIYRIKGPTKNSGIPARTENWTIDHGSAVVGTKTAVTWPEELKGETSSIIILHDVCVDED